MPVAYCLDERDCLISMNGQWDRFAKGNGAPELAANQIVNQPLWRFVAGVEVAQIYRQVFWKVRERNVQVVFPFRCDSDCVHRDMLMKILPRKNGHIELTCITKSIVRLSSPLPHFAQREQADPAVELQLLCSWCKRANVAGKWIPIELAIKTLDWFGSASVPQLTHGICDTCRDEIAEQLG